MNAGQPVHVEALVAEVAVEALDMGVVDRLAGADEVEFHARAAGPSVDGLADELGAVVANNSRGLATMCSQQVELSGNSSAADGGRDDGRECLAGELVDDVENTEAAAIDGGIGDEVHRPALVRARGRNAHEPWRTRDAFALLPAQREPFCAVESINRRASDAAVGNQTAVAQPPAL